MTEAARIDARAAEWLALQDGDAWSDTRQHDLDAWLAASTAHRVAYLRMRNVWQRADVLRALPHAGQPSGTASRAITAAPLPRFSRWRAAAAVLLSVTVAGAAAGWWQAGRGVEYRTAVGVHQPVSLADGSRMLLNTDTRLRAAVTGDARRVRLERGEAYFEVTHDPAHPFVVHAGDQRITVLGTNFSVRREADKVVVAVVEGQVRVDAGDAAGSAGSTVLGRNDVAVATAGQLQRSTRSAEQIANDLSWRQGKVVFDQITLAQAAGEFNRYNAKKLVIADPATAGIRIGGRFEVANVEAFARLLHQGFGVDVREAGGRIIVSGARTGS